MGIVKLSCIWVAIQEACCTLLMHESLCTESPELQISNPSRATASALEGQASKTSPLGGVKF